MDLAAKVYENAAKEKQNEEDNKSKDDTKEKVEDATYEEK